MAEWKGSILISIPTFGTMDVELFVNLQLMHVPIHRSIVWHVPRNMPIAEARTLAVETALKDGCNYILFRDYDVLAPPNALNVLMARDVDVICAPYLSKQKPPWPLIIKDKAPTWAWKHGDVVKCDRVGMGFTLIKTELFERLPKPWFQTSHKEHAELGINAPAVQSYTEDIFFCERLYEELGIRPYADTSVFCVHLDLKTRERYMYDPEHHVGTWVGPNGAVRAVPPVTSDICSVVDATTPPKVTDPTKKGSEPSEEAGAMPATGAGPTG